jgi:uncharacterized protein YycO
MKSFKEYKKILEQTDDVSKLEPKALKWLKGKYGDMYDFKYIKGMEMDGDGSKTYSVTVDNDHFKLNLRKFSSEIDKEGNDVVGFDIQPSVAPEEIEKEQEL